jgi:hypothetical protein
VAELIDQILNKIKPQVQGWVSLWHGNMTTHPGLLNFGNATLCKGLDTDIEVFWASIPRAMTIKSWVQTLKVDVNNNDTDYWYITLVGYTSYAVYYILATLDTKSVSADTWTRIAIDINAAVPVTDMYLAIEVTNYGSPGHLDLAGPEVFVI